jgi:hypothetical protein
MTRAALICWSQGSVQVNDVAKTCLAKGTYCVEIIGLFTSEDAH